MTLAFPPYNILINFVENEQNELVIENQAVFREFLSELWDECNGKDGRIILAENDKILNISKHMDIIFNPFSIDCNDKKILTRLYQELSDIALTDMVENVNHLNSDIINFIDQLVDKLPYHMDFSLETDIAGLLKFYNVKLFTESNELLERLTDYLRAMHSICGISHFAFAELRNYLTVDELKKLLQFCAYEKINILNITSKQSELCSGIKTVIIDKDLCILEF